MKSPTDITLCSLLKNVPLGTVTHSKMAYIQKLHM